MQDPHSNREAEEAAARWAVRLSEGRASSGVEAELKKWLQADRRHGGMLLRAQAALHAMESAVRQGPSVLASDNDHEYGQTGHVAARLPRGTTAVLAACLAVCMVGLGWLWLAPRTGGPGPEQMDLADGTVVTLGEDAAVSVEMSDSARTVTLDASHATFNVVSDPRRPFVVRSGDVFAQAVGTVYTVARVGTRGAAIEVSQGSVLVWADGDPDRTILLAAGEKLTLDPGRRGMADSRPRHINLDNVSIADAAQRFNRVNRVQIVVEDPRIGDVRIVGLFNINDPEQFAQAAAIVAGADIARGGDTIMLRIQGSGVTKN